MCRPSTSSLDLSLSGGRIRASSSSLPIGDDGAGVSQAVRRNGSGDGAASGDGADGRAAAGGGGGGSGDGGIGGGLGIDVQRSSGGGGTGNGELTFHDLDTARRSQSHGHGNELMELEEHDLGDCAGSTTPLAPVRVQPYRSAPHHEA